MNVHKLKIWPVFFDDVANGLKTFEFRRDDRDFQVGDKLELEEFRVHVGEWTGRKIERVIVYVLRHDQKTALIGLPDGYCILGIAP